MDLWITQPTLLHGEHVEHECLGNLFRGHRQVGVRVTVTDQRMIVIY